jgi:hypothetical protein
MEAKRISPTRSFFVAPSGDDVQNFVCSSKDSQAVITSQ